MLGTLRVDHHLNGENTKKFVFSPRDHLFFLYIACSLLWIFVLLVCFLFCFSSVFAYTFHVFPFVLALLQRFKPASSPNDSSPLIARDASPGLGLRFQDLELAPFHRDQ